MAAIAGACVAPLGGYSPAMMETIEAANRRDALARSGHKTSRDEDQVDAAAAKRARKAAKRLREAGKPAVVGKLYADGHELGVIHAPKAPE